MKKAFLKKHTLLALVLIIFTISFDFLIKGNFKSKFDQADDQSVLTRNEEPSLNDEESVRGGPIVNMLDPAIVNTEYFIVLDEDLMSDYKPKIKIGDLPIGLELKINSENKLEIVGIPKEAGNYVFHIAYHEDYKKAYSITVLSSGQALSGLTVKLNYFHICDYVNLSNEEKFNQEYRGSITGAYFKIKEGNYYLVNNDCEIEVLINDSTSFSPPINCIPYNNCFNIYDNKAFLISLTKHESSLDLYLRSAEVINKDQSAYKYFIENNLGSTSIKNILSQPNNYLNKKFELSAYLRAGDRWTYFLEDNEDQIEVFPWLPYSVAQCPPEMDCDMPASMGHFVNKKLNVFAELKQTGSSSYYINVLEVEIVEEEIELIENTLSIESSYEFIACDNLPVPNDLELQNLVRDNCFMMLANDIGNIEACYFISDINLKKNCYQAFDNCKIIDSQLIIGDCENVTAEVLEDPSNWESETFIDKRDNQEYPWVKIGDQTWMAKNLNYDNGCLVKDWINRQENTWCGYYNNDKDKYFDWGILYQWSAANQGVCPDGWRVPSDQDFKQLEIFLGIARSELDAVGWREYGEVGKKLKSTHWNGTNDFGFSLLPLGFKYSGGTFHESNYGSAEFMTNPYTQNFINLLSSTLVDETNNKSGHWFRSIGDGNGIYRHSYSYGSASYIRCIKN